MKVTFINRNIVLMKFKTIDDIVKWMMKYDYDISYEKTVQNFMKSYAERKRLFSGAQIKSGSVNEFIEDLVKNNIIRIENM